MKGPKFNTTALKIRNFNALLGFDQKLKVFIF